MEGIPLDQQILDLVLRRLFLKRANRVQRGFGRVHDKVVVAVDSGDLLNDVSLHGDVLGRSVGGHPNREPILRGFHAKAQSLQRFSDRLRRDVYSGIPIHKGLVKVQHHRLVVEGIFIGQRRSHLHPAVNIL